MTWVHPDTQTHTRTSHLVSSIACPQSCTPACLGCASLWARGQCFVLLNCSGQVFILLVCSPQDFQPYRKHAQPAPLWRMSVAGGGEAFGHRRLLIRSPSKDWPYVSTGGIYLWPWRVSSVCNEAKSSLVKEEKVQALGRPDRWDWREVPGCPG